MNDMKAGYAVRHFTGETKRYCQTLDLKDRPELIAVYKALHAEDGVWQETLDAIHAAGILEMEIYLLGNRLFMIVEMPAELAWDEAMAKMGQMPKQKEWEALTGQYQMAAEGADSAGKWHLMERIFHLYR